MLKKNVKLKKFKNKTNPTLNLSGLAPVWIVLITIIIIIIGLGVLFVFKTNITKNEERVNQVSVNKSFTKAEKDKMIKDVFSPLSKAMMKNKKDKGFDSDKDGLSDNKEKEVYKTDPQKADTDDDGLSDWQEIVVYQTDPLKSDTDGDGTNDKQEIENNSNPKGEGQRKMNGTGSSPLENMFMKR